MHINYNSAADLQAFLDDKGLGMRKKYGQNFLINPGTRRILVETLQAAAGESVWEIGPGLGAMTKLLLDEGLKVQAFEIDPGFIRVLKDLFSGNSGFTLVEGDVLKTWKNEPAAPYLLGNLPYNIGAVLLANFIEQKHYCKRMVVTVQREVAQRMAAAAGSADYSSFSVLCTSAYHVKPLMVIRRASFYPRPNVDSQAVLLELRTCPQSGAAVAQALPSCFYPLVRRLFSSRRKTIKNNLAGFTVSGKKVSLDVVAQALKKSNLDGGRRAEELVLNDFTTLAQTIEDMGILH